MRMRFERIRNSPDWHKIGILASQRRKPGGFTLIETVFALGIFAVVVVLAVGAALAINNAQLKAVGIQVLQDNLRFALESITKEMRTGSAFQPAVVLGPSAFGQISFIRKDGVVVAYCLANGAIEKATGGAACPSAASSPVTGDDIAVEALVFYVIGHSPGSGDGQPRLTVTLRASPRDPRFASTFRLQSTVTPRVRDQ